MPAKRQDCRTFTSRLLATVVLCGFAFGGARATDSPSLPQPEEIHRIDARAQKLEIRDVTSVMLEFPDWVTTVKSLDPSVIHVTAIRPDCLRVRRISDGLSTLRVVDRHDREYHIEVMVVSSSEARK